MCRTRMLQWASLWFNPVCVCMSAYIGVSVCACAHACMHVTMHACNHVHSCGGQGKTLGGLNIGWITLFLSVLLTRDRVPHWTWNSPLFDEPGWPASPSYCTVLHLQPCWEYRCKHLVQPLFGNRTQVLTSSRVPNVLTDRAISPVLV